MADASHNLGLIMNLLFNKVKCVCIFQCQTFLTVINLFCGASWIFGNNKGKD